MGRLRPRPGNGARLRTTKLRHDRLRRPDRRHHRDRPAGLLHDPVDDRQPQPGPLVRPLGGEERVEDLVKVLLWDALPGVCNLDRYLFSVTPCFERDGPSGEHRVAGIQDQIGENLLKLTVVPQHARRDTVVLFYDRDIRITKLRFEKLKRIIEQLIDIDLDPFDRVSGTREIEQVADDVRGTLGLPLHLLQEGMFRVRVRDHAEQHLSVA